MIIMGIGMGPAMPVFTLASQNAVKINQLGVVTALTQFARSIGSTLGVAVFGSLLTNRFQPSFINALSPDVKAAVPPAQLAQFENPQALLNPQLAESMRQGLLGLGPQGSQLFDALFGAVRLALVGALQDVFLTGAILSALGVVAMLFLRELPLRKTNAPLPPQMSEASETMAQVGNDAVPSLPPLRPADEPSQPVISRR
jgi:hypothetical protein